MDNEFLLQDRIQKIQQIITQYGEENFYIAFSGGKDSTVLSALIDLAIPENKIPRVYSNTGIELDMIRDFVFELAKEDSRIDIARPAVPITIMLKKEGYPFKSKIHSHCVNLYQTDPDKKCGKDIQGKDLNIGILQNVLKNYYINFLMKINLGISDMCCIKLKEEPMINWAIKNKKDIAIIGVMQEEKGRRSNSKCLIFNGKKLKKFQPLVPMTKDWEDWFIDAYNIQICDIYKPPYNFERTGCKGCPFALKLQKELDTLEKFFPNERKQCEIIWKPVYDEYRRIGYRLKEVKHEK